MSNRLIIISCLALVLGACTKTNEDVENPFDQVGNGGGNNTGDTLDPQSIAGLHKQIFAVRCANPLCHDGSFEPDFRTIQSTYSHLVYHEVVKNNASNDFTYRVIPHDPDNSWLIERLTTDDAVLGRMPLYADPLTDEQLNNIKAWINDGCKDVNGQPAKFPNLKPKVITRLAYDEKDIRIDTSYSGGRYSPFKVKPGSQVRLLFLVRDDSTAGPNLSLNQVKFSYDPDDFSNATIMQATHFTQDYFVLQFDPNQFDLGEVVYFRYYVKDEHNASPTEFPEDQTRIEFKSFYAFIVQ